MSSFLLGMVGLPAPRPEIRRGASSAAAASAARRRTSSPAGLLGQRVRLPGPQVEAVGVALLARGRAQRRGQVVDLGVGARGVGRVLAQEAVDDAARGAAGERARERGRRRPRRAPSRCAGDGARLRACA